MDRSASLERQIAALEAQVEQLRIERHDASGEGAMMKALLDSIEARRGIESDLQSTQEWLHLAQIAGGVAAYSVDFATMTNEWSPSAIAMYGFPPDHEITFQGWLDSIHPDDLDAVLVVVKQTVEEGHDVDHRFRIVRGNEVRWILDRGRVMRDENGKPARLVGINVDITHQQKLEADLRFSNDFLNSVLAVSTDCVKVIDLDGSLNFMNANGMAAMEIDDFSQVEGSCWAMLWPEENRLRVERAVEDAKLGQRSRFDASCPTAKGTPKHWEVTVSPIHDGEGKVVRIVSVSRDITEQVSAQERMALINRELHHRIKNSLATAQALARSTINQATDLKSFEEDFTARLSSLAQIHSLLGQGADAANLDEIIAQQLEPFMGAKAIGIEGPTIRFDHERAVAIAIIVHELVTNACKYGGLSDAGGGIDIGWTFEDGRVRVRWQEQGGVLAQTSATDSGFGSQLTRRLVMGGLRGKIEAQKLDDGFLFAIEFPHAN